MDNLPLKYLSSLYWASQTNEILELITDTKIYGEDLVEELITMFQISDVVATAYIEIWLYDEYSTFDTKKFWEDKKHWWADLQGLDFGTLPSAGRIYATTVGLDLVAVQPLSAPSGISTFMDFQYDSQSAITQSMGVPQDRLGSNQIQVTLNERDDVVAAYQHLKTWGGLNFTGSTDIQTIVQY